MKSMVLVGCALLAPAVAFSAEPADALVALEARIQALEVQAAEAAAALAAARAEIEVLRGESRSREGVAADSTGSPRTVSGESQSTEVAAADSTRSARTVAGNPAGSNANAFNPAISVILDGQYSHHSLDPAAYARSGFPLTGEAGPGEQGLALGESEISLSSNIDEKFYGQVTLAVESEDGETELGLEEAFIDTTALPGGLTLRFGRFFSNIGYLNNHHAHTDEFPDRPLAYQAFLGGQYGDDGVQLRWVAPTDLYLELGGEVLRGSAEDGVGAVSVFAHAGGDVGVEHSWLAGLSLLRSEVEDGEDGFSGDADLWLADLTWKWAPDGNTRDGGVQLRTEWFLDERDGEYVDAEDPLLDQPWHGTRRGAYLEAVYRIDRQWEAGYRYDRLWADDEGPYASDFDPSRHGVVLTWHNSEFSLLRLLLGRDRPNADEHDNVLLLQYQAAFGAHGSHKF